MSIFSVSDLLLAVKPCVQGGAAKPSTTDQPKQLSSFHHCLILPQDLTPARLIVMSLHTGNGTLHLDATSLLKEPVGHSLPFKEFSERNVSQKEIKKISS